MSYDTMTRKINLIVIHEAQTPTGEYFDADDIEQWHEERGEWKPSSITHKYIGYHWVILLDGTIQAGRHPNEIGAHAKEYNTNSLGICLIGIGKYTPEQWDSLQSLLEALKGQYEGIKIIGHNEVSSKTCPGFDVQDYLANDMVPSDEHIYKA